MNHSVAGEIDILEIQSFEDLPLSMEVLKSIKELGFESLFPIQAQAIIPLLEGKDVIGQAQTGTGKTAAFGVPMVERLNPQIRKVQGLILVPTRELAVQVAQQMSSLRSTLSSGFYQSTAGLQSRGKYAKSNRGAPNSRWYTRPPNRPSGKAGA
jgi:superfamily II DNA/RNA helicase